MKNWIKENWFKLGILVIFLLLSWSMINFMQQAIDLMESFVDSYVRSNAPSLLDPLGLF